MGPHIHHVQIYYEDTDFSGIVYHPNYLKYFERAREHMLGVEELVRLWDEDGIGFVVYRCSMEFKEGARYGDHLEIRTTARMESEYRAVFDQQVWRPGGKSALVKASIEMVAVNRSNQLVKMPAHVRSAGGWEG
ncbi:MAG: YbgC/FadM family acyl-CoA thioesterase [Alphaproteobacteria bacterium]|nr:YbgC/FadM family acyl-CoA thioesterase [Alphaproteobacteria bacterium]